MKNRYVLWAIFMLAGCRGAALERIALSDLDGSPVTVGAVSGDRASVFVFLDPECPLSQNYTMPLQQLHEEYVGRGVVIVGVFPGDIAAEAVREFMQTYKVGFSSYLDPEMELTSRLDATVTPEAIVISRDQAIVYRGAIDNWAIDLGKKRTLVTAHYLSDALEDLVADRAIRLNNTKPVGCYIEKRR